MWYTEAGSLTDSVSSIELHRVARDCYTSGSEAGVNWFADGNRVRCQRRSSEQRPREFATGWYRGYHGEGPLKMSGVPDHGGVNPVAGARRMFRGWPQPMNEWTIVPLCWDGVALKFGQVFDRDQDLPQTHHICNQDCVPYIDELRHTLRSVESCNLRCSYKGSDLQQITSFPSQDMLAATIELPNRHLPILVVATQQ